MDFYVHAKIEIDMLLIESKQTYTCMERSDEYPLMWNGTSQHKKILLHLLNEESHTTYKINELLTDTLTVESMRQVYHNNNIFETSFVVEVSDIFQRVVLYVSDILSETLHIPSVIMMHYDRTRCMPADETTDDDVDTINFNTWVMPVRFTLSDAVFEHFDKFIDIINTEKIKVCCYEDCMVMKHTINE